MKHVVRPVLSVLGYCVPQVVQIRKDNEGDEEEEEVMVRLVYGNGRGGSEVR